VETAVEAMKLGAFDYIPKPFTPDEVAIVVKKAIEKKKSHAGEYLPASGVTGKVRVP